MFYKQIILVIAMLSFTFYAHSQPTLLMPTEAATDISKTTTLEWTGNAGAYSIEIYACHPDSANAGTLQLDNFELATGLVEISEIYGDLSGLTYNPLTGTFFGPSNGIPMIFEIDKNGSHIRTITLTGFQDTEGLVWIGGNEYFVIEERKGRAVKITIEAGTVAIDYPDEYIQLSGTWGNNLGLEGIAYEASTNRLFLLKEKSPAALYAVEIPENLPTTITPTNLFDLNTNNFDCTDFSGMHYSAANGHLLLLSHETYALIETDMAGNEMSRLSLNEDGAGGSLLAGIFQAEGVSIDNEGHIYVVSEPNTFYKFANPNPTPPFDIAALTFSNAAVVANSYAIPTGILLSETQYCWRVKDNTTTGEWSAFWSFTTSTNVAPTTTLTAPADSMIFTDLAPFTITADANDTDGNIAYVKFFVNGDSIGMDATAPYSMAFTPPDYATYQVYAQVTDNEAATTTTNTHAVEVTDMTAYETTKNISNFLLSPNPLTDSLTVSFQTTQALQNAQILIYDTTGRKVITQALNSSTSQNVIIDISQLPMGIYILTLDANGEYISQTFLKR